jgi:NAD(P)-dependent dehydrogenase (short-subunit alcohol dehydrogenase family)
MFVENTVVPGDVAVVTGAASGIGEAAVLRLQARGWAVIGVDLDPPSQRLATAEGTLLWVRGTVSSTDTWTQVLETARSLGRLPTSLVSNAARFGGGTVLTTSLDAWQGMFEVNVFGAVRALQACLPGMIQQGRGTIVTVTSVDAFMAEQGLAAYCSSKGALLQLTRCVAVDFARAGIRANTVCPGTTDTPAFRRVHDSFPDPERFLTERQERNPLGRILSSDEVARAIEFLASEDSAGMTGAAVTVDGGLSASFDFRGGPEAAGPTSN